MEILAAQLESLTVSVFNNQSVSYNPFYNTHIHCFLQCFFLIRKSYTTTHELLELPKALRKDVRLCQVSINKFNIKWAGKEEFYLTHE